MPEENTERPWTKTCQFCEFVRLKDGVYYCREDSPKGGGQAGWPEVNPDDWCGKFRTGKYGADIEE